MGSISVKMYFLILEEKSKHFFFLRGADVGLNCPIRYAGKSAWTPYDFRLSKSIWRTENFLINYIISSNIIII